MAGGELVLASRLRSISMLRSLKLCGTAFSAPAVSETGCRSAAFLLSAPLPLKHHHLHQLACRNSNALQQRLNVGELQGQKAGLGGAHCKSGCRLQGGQRSLCKERHSKGLMSTLWAGQHQKRHEYHLGSKGVSVQCNSTSAQSNGDSGSQTSRERRRVVFLGTPEVAAGVLRRLLDEAGKEDAIFEVTGVVSQPAAKQGRGRKLLPSPVSSLAVSAGISEDRLLCPETAREEDFLSKLSDLAPDLCITAAYGNILPKKFLSIPRFGTLNIHPSLLPLYRGASPVQRALEAGEKVTGVTVAFTVRAMDAGPIVAQEEVKVDPNVKAPELLEDLFKRGTELLLRSLPSVFDGSAAERATEQDDARKTEAPKVRIEEADLDFAQPASVLHNKVRAFAGWPGTKATFHICPVAADGESRPEESEAVTIKIITTRVVKGGGGSEDGAAHEVTLAKTGLHVRCGDGSVLEIQEVQPPSKKPMRARDFWNGLRGRRLYRSEARSTVLS